MVNSPKELYHLEQSTKNYKVNDTQRFFIYGSTNLNHGDRLTFNDYIPDESGNYFLQLSLKLNLTILVMLCGLYKNIQEYSGFKCSQC